MRQVNVLGQSLAICFLALNIVTAALRNERPEAHLIYGSLLAIALAWLWRNR